MSAGVLVFPGVLLGACFLAEMLPTILRDRAARKAGR
jgi:hypothetical protein